MITDEEFLELLLSDIQVGPIGTIVEDFDVKTETTIQCISCGVELDNMEYRDVEVHPDDGLHFRSYGHYGSAVFDPMNGHVLDIAICDLCIMNNLDRVRGNGAADLKKNYEIYHDAAVKNADQNQMRKEYDK